MNYETIAIFKTAVSEDQIEKVSSKLEKAVGKKPGKFVTKKNWGTRTLSYEINKEKQGQYYSWKYADNPESPAQVDKLLRYDEDILRFITFRLDREEIKNKKAEEDEKERGKKMPSIDFRNPVTLVKYISERGKIIPRRVTGVDAQTQNYISESIKRARQLALLSNTDGFSNYSQDEGARGGDRERGRDRDRDRDRGGERNSTPRRESRTAKPKEA